METHILYDHTEVLRILYDFRTQTMTEFNVFDYTTWRCVNGCCCGFVLDDKAERLHGDFIKFTLSDLLGIKHICSRVIVLEHYEKFDEAAKATEELRIERYNILSANLPAALNIKLPTTIPLYMQPENDTECRTPMQTFTAARMSHERDLMCDPENSWKYVLDVVPR